jgi:hypothetical protein
MPIVAALPEPLLSLADCGDILVGQALGLRRPRRPPGRYRKPVHAELRAPRGLRARPTCAPTARACLVAVLCEAHGNSGRMASLQPRSAKVDELQEWTCDKPAEAQGMPWLILSIRQHLSQFIPRAYSQTQPRYPWPTTTASLSFEKGFPPCANDVAWHPAARSGHGDAWFWCSHCGCLASGCSP